MGCRKLTYRPEKTLHVVKSERSREQKVEWMWLSIDPHADSYYGINPYNYTVNNPVLLVDPDGKDAIVSIDGNTITVTTNIFIYGSGASAEQAKKIQKAINSYWSKNGSTYTDEDGKEFDVVFNTNVEVYDEEDPQDSPFIIPESWNPNNTDNFIEVSDEVGRSFVQGGDEGEWFSKGQSENSTESSKNFTYAHEFGHLLGLDDRYEDKNGNSVTNKGYENQIMGAFYGKVDQRAVDGVVRQSVKKYNKFVEKYGNKEASKKPYTTKIDIARPKN